MNITILMNLNMVKVVPTCKLERQMGIGGNASGSSPEQHHHDRCHDEDDDCEDDDCDHYDGDSDDKPRLRPLQSVGLCNLNSPAQEPVSPADKGATANT